MLFSVYFDEHFSSVVESGDNGMVSMAKMLLALKLIGLDFIT